MSSIPRTRYLAGGLLVDWIVMTPATPRTHTHRSPLAGTLVLLVAIALAACVPSPPTSSPQPSDSAEGHEPNDYTGRIDPSSLVDLTPAEITAIFTIPAVGEDGTVTTPEEYAALYVRNEEAAFTAGSAPADVEPYHGAAPEEQYEAMSAKYDQAIANGMFVSGFDLASFIDRDYVTAFSSAAYSLGYAPYDYRVTLESVEVVEPQSSPEDAFTIKIVVHRFDNLAGSELEAFHQKNSAATVEPFDSTQTLLLRVVNEDGALKSSAPDIL